MKEGFCWRCERGVGRTFEEETSGVSCYEGVVGEKERMVNSS